MRVIIAAKMLPVLDRGAGRALTPEADLDEIRAAVGELLADADARAAARAMASIIDAHAGAAVTALEGLLAL